MCRDRIRAHLVPRCECKATPATCTLNDRQAPPQRAIFRRRPLLGFRQNNNLLLKLQQSRDRETLLSIRAIRYWSAKPWRAAFTPDSTLQRQTPRPTRSDIVFASAMWARIVSGQRKAGSIIPAPEASNSANVFAGPGHEHAALHRRRHRRCQRDEPPWRVGRPVARPRPKERNLPTAYPQYERSGYMPPYSPPHPPFAGILRALCTSASRVCHSMWAGLGAIQRHHKWQKPRTGTAWTDYGSTATRRWARFPCYVDTRRRRRATTM